MSKIIGVHVEGNSLYVIKKRGIWDAIKDGFSGGGGRLDIEKPDFKPLRKSCHGTGKVLGCRAKGRLRRR